MGFLDGKRALITGLASKRSIAWGIADAMHKQGAELAFTYQNDRLKDRVTSLAADFGSNSDDYCVPQDSPALVQIASESPQTAADDEITQPANRPPKIVGFTGQPIEQDGDSIGWMFKGTVVDDDNVRGLTVEFGGVFPEGTSTTVDSDGSFLLIIELPYDAWGFATAQVTDTDGETSAKAFYYVST